MTNDAPSPAETYEHYLSPAMADPLGIPPQDSGSREWNFLVT